MSDRDEIFISEYTERGALCYIFMCIERYLKALYYDCELIPIARIMWQYENQWWDEENDDRSLFKLIPSYMMQFDSYDKACFDNNSWKLSFQEYTAVNSIYSKSTAKNAAEELERIFHIPLLFLGIETESSEDEMNSKYIKEIEEILFKNNIPLPKKEKLKPFKYEERWKYLRKKDTALLSDILNH